MTVAHTPESLRKVLLRRSVKDPKTGCRVWRGAIGKGGYGNIKYQGKTYNVHRAAAIFVYRMRVGKKNVLHRCDNPPCFRKKHLRPGTQSQNVFDAIKRGRWGHQ